ncbi:hypothetical protein SPB21_02435 [Leptothoe sp. ISB3NOV94-8A]
MGFLNFFQNQQTNDSQLALLEGQEATLIDSTEPTRKLANERLLNEATKRGGNQRTYRRINAAAVQQMLGENPAQLYDALGIPRHIRKNLPQEAKEALMVGDIAAFEQILNDNAIGHDSLVESATEGYRKARGIFRWNR